MRYHIVVLTPTHFVRFLGHTASLRNAIRFAKNATKDGNKANIIAAPEGQNHGEVVAVYQYGRHLKKERRGSYATTR